MSRLQFGSTEVNMSGVFSDDEFYGAAGRSPLDEAGRAALGGLRWSGAVALTFGSLLLFTGLRSFPAVITLAGLLMAVWVTVAAFIGLMRGLSA
jgi:hypothetical protein